MLPQWVTLKKGAWYSYLPPLKKGAGNFSCRGDLKSVVHYLIKAILTRENPSAAPLAHRPPFSNGASGYGHFMKICLLGPKKVINCHRFLWRLKGEIVNEFF